MLSIATRPVSRTLQQSVIGSCGDPKVEHTIASTEVTLAESGEYVDILSAMVEVLSLPNNIPEALAPRSREDVLCNMCGAWQEDVNLFFARTTGDVVAMDKAEFGREFSHVYILLQTALVDNVYRMALKKRQHCPPGSQEIRPCRL